MFEIIRRYQMDIMLGLSSACIAFAFLLFFTQFLARRRKEILIFMEFVATFLLYFDRMAYLYSGDTGHKGYIMVRVSNFFVFVLTAAIVLGLDMYIADLIKVEAKKTTIPKRLYFVGAAAIFEMFLVVLSQFTGMYYYFDENNVYHRGPLFLGCYVIPVLCPLIQYSVVRKYKSAMSRLVYYSIVAYIFVPIIGGIIQIFAYGISLVNMMMVMVSITMYVSVYIDMNKTVVRAHKIEIGELKDGEQRMKRLFDQDPDVEVRDFIVPRTVDQLTRSELSECARECAAARMIVLEDFYPQLHSLMVRPETTVVQLWHACGAFKTFGFSHMDKPGGAPQSSMNHRNYDLVTVSSEKIRGIYAEAFAIPVQKVKALGVPRTDDLFDRQYMKEKREELYRRYQAAADGRVVLFAPTFRGEGNKDAYYPPEAFDVRRFMERMPEDVVLIIKNHPFVREPVHVPDDLSDRVLDLSGGEHINDLMLISDLLITDYSSCIFEAALLELPMLFYAFDLAGYEESRDFYFDYRKIVPGPVVKTLESLADQAADILNQGGGYYDDKQLAGKLEDFREVFLSALDGQGTRRIYDYLRNLII